MLLCVHFIGANCVRQLFGERCCLLGLKAKPRRAEESESKKILSHILGPVVSDQNEKEAGIKEGRGGKKKRGRGILGVTESAGILGRHRRE